MISSNYRFEEKFTCNPFALVKILSLLEYNSFFKSYPSRLVYSLYFDTPTLGAFADNLSGIKNRIKHRLRWYSATENSPYFGFQLESKIKEGKWGKKSIRIIDGITENTPISEVKSKIIDSLKFSDPVYASFHGLEMQLVCCYRRSYFENYQKIRFTVDEDLLYSMPLAKELYQLPYSGVSSVKIVECKFEVNQRLDALRILKKMPVSSVRCSKYALGQSILYGHSYL